jgi:hypothetical protein
MDQSRTGRCGMYAAAAAAASMPAPSDVNRLMGMNVYIQVGSVVKIVAEDKYNKYPLVALTRLGRGRFLRTKIVTLMPRIQIINSLDFSLQYAQEECAPVTIAPGEEHTLFWRIGPREMLALSAIGEFQPYVREREMAPPIGILTQ